LFKVKGWGPPGIWRGVFPVSDKETDEEAVSMAGIQRRLQGIHQKSGDYEVPYYGLYAVHQRVAATFNKGRILLAGDCAHVNNPIGGMGMNGGIHDAINLAEKLSDVWFGRSEESVLDRYTRQRRKAQVDYVQAQTIQNKKNLEEKDPVIRRGHLDQLRRTSEDVALHKNSFTARRCSTALIRRTRWSDSGQGFSPLLLDLSRLVGCQRRRRRKFVDPGERPARIDDGLGVRGDAPRFVVR
jgi:3-(3-hydroxy-phenyl)propionate hydroxylase